MADDDASYCYLDASRNEGLGALWAYDGRPLAAAAPVCTLCCEPSCATPQRARAFDDLVWYTSLGTTTRYADQRGRTRKRTDLGAPTVRNALAFVGPCAVVHLGDGEPGEPVFAVFDRVHAHRVVEELHWGNSLYAEAYGAPAPSSTTHLPYRAKWSRRPASSPTTSLLFHRWLVLPTLEAERACPCVEHLNDVALDCREANLRPAKDHRGNNNQIHTLKHALWEGGRALVAERVARLSHDQRPYWAAVEALPPLPDSVFARKRFFVRSRL